MGKSACPISACQRFSVPVFQTVFRRIKAALQYYRIYRAARFGWHFCRDPIFRRDHVLLWRRPARLYQHRSVTAPERYPRIFTFIRDKLAGVPAPRLLSFGCATGEEVFSLREYFPSGTIKGIDINPANIAACLRRWRKGGSDPHLAFEHTDSAAREPAASYDAVFCMAVFVRWPLKEDPNVATSLPHLSFADFERATTELAGCVRPGGFLIVRHAMFRFGETAAAKDFQCVLRLPKPEAFFPRFGSDNRRLPDSPDEGVIFRKLENAHPR